MLEGIISQQIIPRADGNGRVAAFELLIATPAVRNLIREGKTSSADDLARNWFEIWNEHDGLGSYQTL